MKTREEFTESVFNKAKLRQIEESKRKAKMRRTFRYVSSLAACLILTVGVFTAYSRHLEQEKIRETINEGRMTVATYSMGECDKQGESQKKNKDSDLSDTKKMHMETELSINFFKENYDENQDIIYKDNQTIEKVLTWIDTLDKQDFLSEEELDFIDKGETTEDYIMIIYNEVDKDNKLNSKSWYLKGNITLPKF